MRKVSPREAKRLMQRMGLSMTPLEVDEVIIKAKDKEITISKPEVTILDLQGQKIFQISGGKISERATKKITISEEDVLLVAQQANVSLEEARAALERTDGDLAQAILLLTQK